MYFFTIIWILSILFFLFPKKKLKLWMILAAFMFGPLVLFLNIKFIQEQFLIHNDGAMEFIKLCIVWCSFFLILHWYWSAITFLSILFMDYFVASFVGFYAQVLHAPLKLLNIPHDSSSLFQISNNYSTFILSLIWSAIIIVVLYLRKWMGSPKD